MSSNELKLTASTVCQPYFTLPDYTSAACCGGVLAKTNNIGWTHPLIQNAGDGPYIPLTTSPTSVLANKYGITGFANQNDHGSVVLPKPYETNVFRIGDNAYSVNSDLKSLVFGTTNKFAFDAYTNILAEPKDSMVFAAGTTNNFIVGNNGLSDLVAGTHTACMFTQPNHNLYIATGAINNYTTSNYGLADLLSGTRGTSIYTSASNDYTVKLSAATVASYYLSPTSELLCKNVFQIGATAATVGLTTSIASNVFAHEVGAYKTSAFIGNTNAYLNPSAALAFNQNPFTVGVNGERNIFGSLTNMASSYITQPTIGMYAKELTTSVFRTDFFGGAKLNLNETKVTIYNESCLSSTFLERADELIEKAVTACVASGVNLTLIVVNKVGNHANFGIINKNYFKQIN